MKTRWGSFAALALLLLPALLLLASAGPAAAQEAPDKIRLD